jgi:hypothetical protein
MNPTVKKNEPKSTTTNETSVDITSEIAATATKKLKSTRRNSMKKKNNKSSTVTAENNYTTLTESSSMLTTAAVEDVAFSISTTLKTTDLAIMTAR